jgi:hypothetical protein
MLGFAFLKHDLRLFVFPIREDEKRTMCDAGAIVVMKRVYFLAVCGRVSRKVVDAGDQKLRHGRTVKLVATQATDANAGVIPSWDGGKIKQVKNG